jgi:hypothetical protein
MSQRLDRGDDERTGTSYRNLPVRASDRQSERRICVSVSATGEGYEYVADPDAGGPERPVYIHRLAAVAWGELDGLDDPRHVHHVTPVPWLNTEANLRAEEPDRHARITHTQQRAGERTPNTDENMNENTDEARDSSQAGADLTTDDEANRQDTSDERTCEKCDDDTEAVAVWHRRSGEDVLVCDHHARVALGWDSGAEVEEL